METCRLIRKPPLRIDEDIKLFNRPKNNIEEVNLSAFTTSTFHNVVRSQVGFFLSYMIKLTFVYKFTYKFIKFTFVYKFIRKFIPSKLYEIGGRRSNASDIWKTSGIPVESATGGRRCVSG